MGLNDVFLDQYWAYGVSCLAHSLVLRPAHFSLRDPDFPMATD